MTLRESFKHSLEAAERFELKTPQYKRIESETAGPSGGHDARSIGPVGSGTIERT
jgi:hypothetical protein